MTQARTTRLSASRVLRAKKILAFIFDKLELAPGRARQGSIVSIQSRIAAIPRKVSGQSGAGGASLPGGKPASIAAEHDPEDVLELLCGDAVVDPKITLATLKHYYGSGGDMLLHYRLKEGVSLS